MNRKKRKCESETSKIENSFTSCLAIYLYQLQIFCINSWIKLVQWMLKRKYFKLPRIFAGNHFSALSSFLPFTDFWLKVEITILVRLTFLYSFMCSKPKNLSNRIQFFCLRNSIIELLWNFLELFRSSRFRCFLQLKFFTLILHTNIIKCVCLVISSKSSLKVQNLINRTPSLENFLETRVVRFWNFQARWGAASGFLPANDIASNFSQWKLFILILWNN